ncbi:MAG: hypothetical protein HFJ03_00410 [Lachnospira sp.]|jgi:hypothetical protein|nr:hypothetical protein [Lachnospira sp.]
MRNKMSIFIAFIILIISFDNNLVVNASEVETDFQIIENENVNFECKILASIENITIKESLIIEGQKNYLYPTFDNNEKAIQGIKFRAKNVLRLLEEKYNLSELTTVNWEEYYIALYNYFTEPDKIFWYNETNKEIKLVKTFFDIYENKYNNENIINLVKTVNNFEDIAYDLYMLLPYNSPYVKRCNEISLCGVDFSNYDISSAVIYAKGYSTRRNTWDYQDYGGQDCTNFASQIMEHAGVPQEKSIFSSVGWWHEYEGYHVNSKSWSSADYFARYMGIDYSTTSHYNFSVNLRAGDFIALDISNDGSWNHIGFVCESDNYLTNGYYDYFVAQHSDDYLAWTSTDVNGWENQESEGNRYGRIRP